MVALAWCPCTGGRKTIAAANGADRPICAGDETRLKLTRVHARRRVLKGAFIVLSDKAPKLESTVTSASETGATLKVSTTFGIPKGFDVIIDGVRRHCRSRGE